MDFGKALKNEKIRNLSTREAVTASPEETYHDLAKKMREARSGCAVILKNKKVIGILTERDILTRGILGHAEPQTPIEKLMTPQPKSLDMEDSVAVAIRLMHDGKYRHLPIVNAEGEFLGLVSVRDIVSYLAENYPCEIFNLPPDPHQVSTSSEGA